MDWEVSDESSLAVSGNWQDSVYLSATPAITSGSVLLGAVEHSGGLAADGNYSASLTTAVPALAPGDYYVLVQVDSLYQVPVTDRAGDTLAAGTGQLQVSVPALALNGASSSGSFTAADQDQYYQVTVPAGGTLQVSLEPTSTATTGSVALYVSQGTLPTPYNYQEVANVANQFSQTVTVPQVPAAGTYYVLAHSVSGAAFPAGYTLTVTQAAALAVTGIGASSGGNAGNMTIEIDGANFPSTATATLTLVGTTTPIAASAIDFVSASQLFATFSLAGAATGNYTLKVQQGTLSATAPTTFQVTSSQPSSGLLSVTVNAPA